MADEIDLNFDGRLSQCKRRTDSRASLLAPHFRHHRRAAPSYRQSGGARSAAVAAGPAGELTFEVRFRTHSEVANAIAQVCF